MTETNAESLRRSLGPLDVFALSLGSVIGTGIFFLPGKVADLMGPAAVLAYGVSAVLSMLVVLCFAEAGSRFGRTGGAIEYSRAAFGEVAGFTVGWATWVARVVSWAALANAFVIALVRPWPASADFSAVVIVALFAFLTALNLRGVQLAGSANTLLAVAKLVPIVVFIAIGSFFVDTSHVRDFAPKGYAPLGETALLVMYAFVGFEGMAIPAAEMRDPRRDVPRALVLGMLTIVVLYLAIWWVCTGTLESLAGAELPMPDAAETFLGVAGNKFVLVGIAVSVVGINAFMALVTPRALYAMSRDGMLPPVFGWVSPISRVPAVAILFTSAVALALALTGTFVKLAVISVVARIVQYVLTCLAVLALRRRSDVPPARFQAPLGPVVPLLAVVVCIWLLSEARWEQLTWGGAGIGAGLPLYGVWRLWRTRRQ